jgi:predicted RNA methylase
MAAAVEKPATFSRDACNTRRNFADLILNPFDFGLQNQSPGAVYTMKAFDASGCVYSQWWANTLTYWSVRRHRQYFRPIVEISKYRNFSQKILKRFKPKHRPKG